MGVIYLRTNLVNGLQYVGQARNLRKRNYCWNCLSYRYGNQLLTDDRAKYGLDNFKVEILEECDDSKLDELEKHYIEILNTTFPNGYNDNEGGVIGFHHSQRTKDKISEANSGKEPYNKGKKYDELFDKETSEKQKQRLSDFAKTRTGEKNPFYGKHHKVHPLLDKHHTEKTKKKISDANTNNPKLSIPIVQVKDDNTVIEWESIREASRNGYDCGNVSKAVNNRYHNVNVYKGDRWYFKDDYNKLTCRN